MNKVNYQDRLKPLLIASCLSLFFILQVSIAQTSAQSGSAEPEKLSLECHQILNPVLWETDQLKPDVRNALLKFADRFAQFSKIPQGLIQDVVMVGGNASYNYTDKSDIDVHVLLDRNKLGSDRAMVDDYVQLKKDFWMLTHNIKVYGYDIEPYVEDLTTLYSKDKGIYSVKDNVWLQKPVQANCTTGDLQLIKQKVNGYKKEIDALFARQASVLEVQQYKEKIKKFRAESIKRGGGEFDFENLVFKELRAQNYIDKLDEYMKTLNDKALSLSRK